MKNSLFDNITHIVTSPGDRLLVGQYIYANKYLDPSLSSESELHAEEYDHITPILKPVTLDTISLQLDTIISLLKDLKRD